VALVNCFIGGCIDIWHQKLRNIGGDVGGAVNEFKKAMKDGQSSEVTDEGAGRTIEGEVTQKITDCP